MFKTGLMITTALILVASVCYAAAQPAAAAGSRLRDSVASRNANDEYLCTYGQFGVSAYRKSISSSTYSSWTHVAVPIKGHGQTVNRITVIEGQSSHTFGSGFFVGIYSNSRHGFPGKLIAGGSGTAPRSCGQVPISITATTLKKNKTYWIEEMERVNGSSYDTRLIWAIDPKKKQKAYVQYHQHSYSRFSSSSYTSPWSQATAGPYVFVR